MFSAKSVYFLTLVSSSLCLLSSCSVVKEHTSPETYRILTFSDGGKKETQLGTMAYLQGNFDKAEKEITRALEENPQNPQALLIGALLYEQIGRPNKARQLYEDLIIYGGSETTILGNSDKKPTKMVDVAQQRLRLLNVRQTKIIIEDSQGHKVFNVNADTAQKMRKETISQALNRRSTSHKSNAHSSIANVQNLFGDSQQNIITRFLILKELAEKDFVTKEEFLNARNTNIGGLLPLTHQPAAWGVDQPVPSPDLIIERINALKSAVESRAITPREFSAERDVIIEALLPTMPRQRLKPQAPSRDILGAAKDLRKLEVLLKLQLITSKEKEKEKQAIENYLGLHRTPVHKKMNKKKLSAPTPATTKNVMPAPKTSTSSQPQQAVVETKVEIIHKEEPKNQSTPQQIPQPLIPNVSSPF